ncbi:MAG: DUF2973 domain-containing protein [Phormidium tanganyikae FI6-MK23]|nr:DUF2973 domain-containing protein [Phormidium tanganyikae FI6-MK23]
MLHLLYILAFTALAFLAVGNLIRNLMALGIDSQRQYPSIARSHNRSAPHPELLDEHGRMINEPLLVMRSMSVEDAREQLDAIYKSSPGGESAQSSDG